MGANGGANEAGAGPRGSAEVLGRIADAFERLVVEELGHHILPSPDRFDIHRRSGEPAPESPRPHCRFRVIERSVERWCVRSVKGRVEDLEIAQRLLV